VMCNLLPRWGQSSTRNSKYNWRSNRRF